MPLRDDLLNPIPGDNPSGVSLRYERIYDQIKEARTEDDESIPVGAWQRQAKKAEVLRQHITLGMLYSGTPPKRCGI